MCLNEVFQVLCLQVLLKNVPTGRGNAGLCLLDLFTLSEPESKKNDDVGELDYNFLVILLFRRALGHPCALGEGQSSKKGRF